MTMNKTIEDTYQKKSQHEHILIRPDTYIDTIKNNKLNIYIFDEEKQKIVHGEKIINSGLYKIFDEILVNASDRTIVDNTCDIIKVNINKETGEITVYNNSNSIDMQIPIKLHKKENMYVPELIFGNLLSGTNFDDTGERIVGGKNGFGAKLTNIYSTHFKVEILNTNDKKKYTQIFRNNMYEKEEPIIKKCLEKNGYTQISFIPDYARFECKNLSEDMYNLFKKRTFDIAGTTFREKAIKVYFNNELINIKSFEDYIKMFYDVMPPYVFQNVNERWSVGIIYDDKSGFKNISYVNRISTFSGGTHVSYIMDQIIEKITEKIKSKYKTLTIKPSLIKDNITIFINSTIGNPVFDSQSKKKLNTKPNEWVNAGFPCELDDKFIKEFCKTGIIEEITRSALSKQDSELNKMNSTKKNSLKGMPKLNDANFAGTSKSDDCTLFLVEGDSAKALAISGLTIIGNDYYGVFPLKGKPLNVRKETDNKKILNNEELANIIKILGLRHNTVYNDTIKLRYGKICILTDQDDDGFHIKGLLMNFIHFYWPSLIKKDFIRAFNTPLVKVFKNSDKSKSNPVLFYNKNEYDTWAKNTNVNNYKAKYYKGLGTSTPAEAKEYFKHYIENELIYVDDGTKTDDALLLAFGPKMEDARKEWVKIYDENTFIDSKQKKISFSEFIHKELKQFSNSDNIRSIPNICDGLKPSQRKVLYCAFKKNLQEEIKVAQFAGYVSEHSGYHHGEASLHGTIINMAQDYCGSNNINLLMPCGQFGTRIRNGKDAASPRYIFTKLNPIANLIFRKDDECVLIYKNEDGDIVEPYQYYPIVPMILINGCSGIGTGYSTDVPSYYILDVIENIRLYLNNTPLNKLKPWCKKFKGTIENINNNFIIRGNYTQLNENTIIITEIPTNMSIDAYCEKLEEMLITDDKKNDKKNDKENDKQTHEKIITEYKNIIIIGSDEDDVNIEVTFKNNELQQLLKNDLLLKNETNAKKRKILENKTLFKQIKLESSISINNMHLYENFVIKKYTDPNDILITYAETRLKKYEERRLYFIEDLKNILNVLFYKKKYIQQVLDEEIIISRQKKADIIKRLEELNYPKLSTKQDKNVSYEYLTNFLLFSLTEEKINELMNEYDKTENELNYYIHSTNKELWLKELKELEEFYKSTMDENTTNPKEAKKEIKKNKQKNTKKNKIETLLNKDYKEIIEDSKEIIEDSKEIIEETINIELIIDEPKLKKSNEKKIKETTNTELIMDKPKLKKSKEKENSNSDEILKESMKSNEPIKSKEKKEKKKK